MSVPEDVTLIVASATYLPICLLRPKLQVALKIFCYGLLTAFEDDVEWLARDVNDKQLLLTGSDVILPLPGCLMARRIHGLWVIWARW